MSKDETVSKLSRLQKRVLIHARQQMLAKGQTIEPRGKVVVHADAPPWLNEVLTTTLGKIFDTRDRYGALAEGRSAKLGTHPWPWFFEEVAFAEQAIWEAAKAADVKDRYHLTELYQYAFRMLFFIKLGLGKHGNIAVSPWPGYGDGWYFTIVCEGEGFTADIVRERFVGMHGEDEVKKNFTISDHPICPINCTIPELLRDLFGFPIREGGHVAAMAFAPEEIGDARYRTAQASLRRACQRLDARGLLWRRAGQRRGLSVSYYERSGIGLNERGVAVADALMQAQPIAAMKQQTKALEGMPQ